MSFALNEVEALAKRASRGAGYSWGLAEEAAKATRWLCARHLDGCAALGALLEANLAESLRDHMPVAIGKNWQGATLLCPLSTGATLSDFAVQVVRNSAVLEDVIQPTLILPFVAYAARQTATCLVVTCGGTEATTDGFFLNISKPFPKHAAKLTVRAHGTVSGQPPLASRASPAPEVWATLNRFAHRTYAPATEQSRMLGAGAGLSDND
ncbi:MAG: DUF3726 domain-containing protein [Paracoccaceae bacterium]